ncbi:hypothetical protein EDB83DRAFT_2553579 [Lactarius deliciosus]|nr:hypothetical protein EDB83DRAFT_2553579 [Lactarius deliciosus]
MVGQEEEGEGARGREGGGGSGRVKVGDSGRSSSVRERVIEVMISLMYDGEGERGPGNVGGTGGAEGRGDGSTGRETEAERERPRRESFTSDREEEFGRADRGGKGAKVSKRGRSTEPGKGAPEKAWQSE